jgi:hypothetical protein
MSDAALRVILTGPAGAQKVGAVVKVSIAVRNVSDRPVWVVGALEGSDIGLRFPHYLPQINGERPALSGEVEYLDMAAPLRLEDFHQLAPGQDFDPMVKLNRALNPLLAAFTEFVPPAPGSYEMWLTLSTASESDNDWLGVVEYPGKDEALRRLAEVPRLRVESNVLTIEAQ